MKKSLLAAIAAILLMSIGAESRAQVVIMNPNTFMVDTEGEISLRVVDSLTSEPIAFASVYLHHPKDTIITDFVLSDAKGNAVLPKVAVGEHVLVIEYMGYKPYTKRFLLKEDVDFGTIRIQQDPDRLKAATITAAATPIEFRQDTTIYNAGAFKTRSGANLGELLKKMPGIEVSSDGGVTVNGESVSRITVGGRTFFMGDNSVALNNIPASIVDKVKVIDKDSEEAQFTGVKEKNREKVMDVELKEEYRKGFFGNVSVGLGSSVPDKDQSEYIENSSPLYETSAMVSAYGEKDQLTAVAGAANVTTGGVMVVSYSVDDLGENPLPSSTVFKNGMGPSWNFGANLNSESPEKVDIDASAMYRGSNQHSERTASSTTYQDGGDGIDNDDSEYRQKRSDSFKTSFEISNRKRDKFLVSVEPSFSYARDENTGSLQGRISSDGTLVNTSSSNTWSVEKNFKVGATASLGIKNLGKEGRSVTWGGGASASSGSGEASEYSSTFYESLQSTSVKDLVYSSDKGGWNGNLYVKYVEPIADNWSLSGKVTGSMRRRTFERDAFDADGSANYYYSAYSNTLYRATSASLMAQYGKEKTTINFGLETRGVNSETVSRSYGMETTSGAGQWNWDIAPSAWIRTVWKNYNVRFSLDAHSSVPSAFQMMPSFNLSNPVRITLGNIYLKPTFDHSITLNLSRSFKESGISFAIRPYITITRNRVVNASWFDEDGIQYLVPVNSPKRFLSGNLSWMFNAPIGESKTLRFSYNGALSLRTYTSYQTRGTLPGIDMDSFDYYSFMEGFWGGEDGDLFFGGKSGFSQSSTLSFYNAHNFSLSKSFENLMLYANAHLYNAISRYSLNSDANTNVWQKEISFGAAYSTEKGWEIATDFGYSTYSGYRNGYNSPYANWDAKIGKSFHSFVFELGIDNILNQHSERNHTVEENFVSDSFYNSLGRIVMFTVRYTFGKAGAAQTAAAQQAQFNMM